jgi:hypothetical protein
MYHIEHNDVLDRAFRIIEIAQRHNQYLQRDGALVAFEAASAFIEERFRYAAAKKAAADAQSP